MECRYQDNFSTTSINSFNNVIYAGNAVNCSTCKDNNCKSSKRNSGYKKSGSYRLKWVVSHWTYPWSRRVAAKVDNYKKKGISWKKYRTSCFARVYGDISNAEGECNGKVTFNTSSGVHASTNARHVEHKIQVATKTKSGWVKAHFYGAGISHSKTLTW